MPLQFELYREQLRHWPTEGRHVLAQYDVDSIIVYQAFRPEIAQYAIVHRAFGGEGFSYSRMSWIKPNFLWMMYRCGWATKEGQEVVLALWLARAGFDAILAAAVPSSFDRDAFADRAAWSAAVARSDVRLQWDPDHDPHGRPLERRAVQLGLRGDALARFADEWIVEIQDVTPIVRAQHEQLRTGGLDALETPRERVYPPRSRLPPRE